MLSKHTFYYFLSHGIPALIGFASIAIFTRMLSPSEYGIYALVVAVSTIVNAIFFEWLKLSLLRFQSKYLGDQHFLETIKISFLMVVCFITSMGLFLIPFLQDTEYGITFILLAILLSISQAWFSLNISLLRARLLPKTYGVVSAQKFSFGLLFGFCFIMLSYGGNGLLVGMILGIILSIIPSTIKNWGMYLSFSMFSKEMSQSFLKYGFPLTATLLLGIIVHNSDRFIINYLLDTSATGVYSVTYDLIEQSIFTLMMIVNLAGYPIIMKRMEENGYELALKEVKKNTFMVLILSIPAMVGAILVSDNLIYLFLGESYRVVAASILPYIVIGAFLKGIKLYGLDVLFHLRESTRAQIIPIATAATLNIILNFFFIPEFGLKGAAISTVLSYFLAVIVTIAMLKKMTSVPFPWIGFIKIAISTIGMCIVLWPIHLNIGVGSLVAQITLGIASFSLFLALLYFKDVKRLGLNVMRR
jgi:O-antigen/teichoic acid export membrane protein